METHVESILRRQNISIIDYMQSLNEEQLTKICIETLRKSPSERSPVDLYILVYATQNVGFFRDLIRKHGTDIHSRLCAKMILDKCSKSSIVFSKGDIGRKFYIILSGKVGIYLPFMQPDNRFAFEEVNQLGAGSFFGELALLTNNPRGATVKCLEECVFGVLDRETFNSILYKITAREIYKQTLFLSQIYLFSNFTKQTIRTLIYHFKQHTYSKGQTIFAENEDADCFYIIKTGEVNLCKFFQTTNYQQSDLYLTTRNKRKIKVSSIFRVQKVANLGQNEIIGEIECIQGSKRHFSAVCASTQAQLYSIRAEDFLKRIVQQNKNEEVSLFLEKYIQDKIEWRNQRLIQIANTIYLEKSQLKIPPEPQAETFTISNRITSYRRDHLGEIYDNQTLEYIVNKKQDVMRFHASPPKDPLSLISQYKVTPYLSKILRSRIDDSTRRLQSQDASHHRCSRLSPIETPSKYHSRKALIVSPTNATMETCGQRMSREKSKPVQFLITSTEFSSSSQFTTPTKNNERDFYKRLIGKAKLKTSWKKPRELRLNDADAKSINLNLSRADISPSKPRRRIKTIS